MKMFVNTMSTDVAVENVLKAQIPEQVFIDESFFFFYSECPLSIHLKG